MTRRTLTLPERRLITRALLHLSKEYLVASLSREQTGDGRSAKMRLIRNAQETQNLALLIDGATELELSQ